MGLLADFFFYAIFAVAITGHLIRVLVIIPALNRHGIESAVMNIHQIRELRDYKRICVAEKTSLRWWRLSAGLYIAFATGVIS